MIQDTQRFAAMAASHAGNEPDNRTEADFVEEVDAYLKEAHTALRDAAFAALAGIAPPIRLVLVNDTERNFSNVAVDALLRGPVLAIDGPLDPVELPHPPRPFGAPTRNPRFPPFGAFAHIASISATLLNPKIASPVMRPTINNTAEGARIEFPSVHLRPHDRVPLDDVVCIAEAAAADETLTLEWKATASDANGEARDQLDVTADSTAWTPRDLLGDDDKASEVNE